LIKKKTPNAYLHTATIFGSHNRCIGSSLSCDKKLTRDRYPISLFLFIFHCLKKKKKVLIFILFFCYFFLSLYSSSLFQTFTFNMSEAAIEEYDLIVIGAGIVGCAAARAFASDGRRVLLLERDLSEPDRIVGELLQPGGVNALKALGMEGKAAKATLG
jgi:hypothetical protein